MSNPFIDRIPPLGVDLEKLRQVRTASSGQAAKGDHPVFAEMAREVLVGRRSLLEAAASSAYRDALDERADQFVEAMREVSMEDIERAAKEHPIDELIAKLNEEDDTTPPRPKPDAEPDDTDFDAPIMNAPTPVERTTPDGEPPQRARWNCAPGSRPGTVSPELSSSIPTGGR